jgi:hypothetical protein
MILANGTLRINAEDFFLAAENGKSIITEQDDCVNTMIGGGLDATVGGLDENGYPVVPEAPEVPESEERWHESISALIVPANLNYLAKSPNENAYVDASYTVLIEYDAKPLEHLRNGGCVKLEGWKGDLGKFSVIGIEPLMAVGIIKITV